MNTPIPIRRAEIEESPPGFSIVELLVVMSIVAILASIAIPRFTSASEESFSASVKSDLRNALAAEEVYRMENGSYVEFDIDDGGSVSEPDFRASQGVSVTATTDGTNVKLVGSHASSPTSWCLNSADGAMVEADDC